MMNRTLGIILIVVGIAMIMWTSFSYTRKEKIIDAGPIQVSADRERTIAWPSYLGGFILVSGIVIVAVSKKNR